MNKPATIYDANLIRRRARSAAFLGFLLSASSLSPPRRLRIISSRGGDKQKLPYNSDFIRALMCINGESLKRSLSTMERKIGDQLAFLYAPGRSEYYTVLRYHGGIIGFIKFSTGARIVYTTCRRCHARHNRARNA